jgi:hypothetical protein
MPTEDFIKLEYFFQYHHWKGLTAIIVSKIPTDTVLKIKKVIFEVLFAKIVEAETMTTFFIELTPSVLPLLFIEYFLPYMKHRFSHPL